MSRPQIGQLIKAINSTHSGRWQYWTRGFLVIWRRCRTLYSRNKLPAAAIQELQKLIAIKQPFKFKIINERPVCRITSKQTFYHRVRKRIPGINNCQAKHLPTL